MEANYFLKVRSLFRRDSVQESKQEVTKPVSLVHYANNLQSVPVLLYNLFQILGQIHRK